MSRTWAISGLDLHLDLSGTRVRESLESELRSAVQQGRLAPGTRLPSSRSLAVDLGIARNTVADAYGQLVAEGWLTARQGAGTTVSTAPHSFRLTADGGSGGVRAARFDLRPGVPDVSSFPRREWLTSARIAIGNAPDEAFGYGDPCGRPELRTALAAYLARARGALTTAEAVMVCSGFTQALWLIAQALHRQGRRVIGVESYGHGRYREILAGAGLRPVVLPVDDEGARPDGLDRLDAVLLTPAHQFPLGSLLSAARRAQFVRWATESGGVIIEDDYDGEFRYDRRPVGALQALAPDHVIYTGTASKTLAPGLRLAWLIAPAPLLRDLAAQRLMLDLHSSAIDQLTFAELIDSGRYDRHVRKSRLVYRRRRDWLVATLAQRAPKLQLTGLPAGLHAILELPDGLGEAEFTTRAAARDLAVEGLGAYVADSAQIPPSLVLGYATPPAHAYTGAIARLCAALEQHDAS